MTERLFEGAPLRSDGDATFTAQVVSTTEADGKVAVELDRTLFYPTGGGQPSDLGVLDDLPIAEVVEEGERILHLVEPGAAASWEPGREVQARVDIERRRDHMEQHSGQHLLSAILLKHGIETLSFHLGAQVTIDVAAERIEAEQITRVEAEVNAAIRACHPVTATVFEGDEARVQAGSLRKEPEAAALASPRGLRIVQFGAGETVIDRDPCCGTHVSNTGQLGAIVLLGTERGKKGETRIAFAVGGRATLAIRARLDALQQVGATLSVGYGELPARGEKLLGRVKELKKDLKRVSGSLLQYEAEALARASQGAVIAHVLEDGDAKQAGAFARACLSARPEALIALVHKAERLTLVVARGDAAPELNAGAVLKDALATVGGKGGGGPTFAQGAVTDVSRLEELLGLARAALEKAAGAS